MDPAGTEAVVYVLVVLGILALFLGTGMWIFAGLLMVSAVSLMLLLDMSIFRVGSIMRGVIWAKACSWELACIPLFVWMGELLFRTDISNRLFAGLQPWVSWLPGRLLHTNVFGCALFAAVSGSGTATTATVGKITTMTLIEKGYDEKLAIGSVAGAGTLGLLIPPSIVLIVYGIIVEQSIARLFAAGLLPGILVAALYSIYIVIRALRDPNITGEKEKSYNMRDFIHSFVDLAPILVLMPIVLGGIYSGIATPTEAAALSVLGALLILVVTRQFHIKTVFEALMGSVRVTCMVITIVVSANFMSTAMGYLHVPQEISSGIAYLDLGRYQLLFLLFLFYIVLGLFLEGISIMVMSLPITYPLILMHGFDPIWFGVFLVITVELAQVTPPVGLNLYVLQGLTGRSIGQVAVASIPFFLLLCLGALIITIFPQIALWLPNQLTVN